MKEQSIGLLAFCNGRQYRLNSLNETVDGVFELKTTIREENGVRLLSPVIENISGDELCFGKAFVSIVLTPGPYEAFTQYCRWSMENIGSWLPLEGRGLLLTHANGRTTEGNSPYLAMRMMGSKDGFTFHVLPLGDWRIRVLPQSFSCMEPPMQVDLGISDETLAFRLKAGDSWALPEVIIQSFRDFDSSTGALHQFLRKYLCPSVKKLPVEYNTWLDVFSQLDIPRLRRQLAVAKELGCEAFVVDAGWFGSTPDWGGVGDWEEKTDTAFFGNMSDFADEVRREGLGFGIWIEPERFQAEIPILKKHPEWFTLVPETGYYRIDLEQPSAYEYQKNLILKLIDKYKLAYIKTDMNAQHGIDETGAAHYRYAKLFYQLMDEIRALHPEMVLECCASGALRTDLEAMRHFDVFFPSDSANPFTQTDMLIGFLRRFLPGKMMRWITTRELQKDEIPFFNKKRRPLIAPRAATWEEFMGVDPETLMLVNFVCGQYGFSGDLASLSQETKALFRKYIDKFKSIREFMLRADGYCLFDTREFKAVELAGEQGAIIVYQWISSSNLRRRHVYPLGLSPEATYRVNGDMRTGTDLMDNGIVLDFEDNQHWKWRAAMMEIWKAD